MIYVTGDTHSEFGRFDPSVFTIQEEMTKEDYVIICGDFGGVWYYPQYPKSFSSLIQYPQHSSFYHYELAEEELDKLDNLPFTTLFVDGNHENFDRLNNYPVIDWYGGKVHQIRPSVLHLMRGEIFNINGKKIWAFGGASSHDVRDGILDCEKDKELIKKWRYDGNKQFRINHISWWEQELPTEEEMKKGLINLKKSGYRVDFMITHCAPQHIASLIFGGRYKIDRLTTYFNQIDGQVEYDKWFFGHYHVNRTIMSKYVALYEQCIQIA